MPAERTTANARLSENDPTAVNVFPAVDFTLTQPAELACIIREARAVSLNVQFNNVELPGGCESSGLSDRVDPDAPLRICNPEEPGDACAVEGGISRAALNLRWICALNTDTRVPSGHFASTKRCPEHLCRPEASPKNRSSEGRSVLSRCWGRGVERAV